MRWLLLSLALAALLAPPCLAEEKLEVRNIVDHSFSVDFASGSPLTLSVRSGEVQIVGVAEERITVEISGENAYRAQKLKVRFQKKDGGASMKISGGPRNGLTITVNNGAYVNDVATVSPSTATGSIAFRYYGTLTACEADTAGSAGTAAGSGTVANGSVTSSTIQFNTSGDYYWRAFFTGTGLNNNSISPCNEVLTVRQNTSDSSNTDRMPSMSSRRG